MIILMDKSGSMSGEKFDTARIAAQRLISSLQQNDFFNIILFSAKPTYLFENQTKLMQGTRMSKEKARDKLIDVNKPQGEANFKNAFKAAFDTLKNSTDVIETSRCHRIIMFLTDGNEKFGDIDDILEDEENKRLQVRVFSYEIGRGNTRQTSTLKKISCRSRGAHYKLQNPGNVWDLALEYTTVLGYPLAYNASTVTPTFVPLYIDNSGGGMVMSVVQPMFKNKSEDDKGILGITAQDISLRELTDIIPNHQLGADGYGFAINNNGFVLFHPHMKTPSTSTEAPTLYLKQLIHSNITSIDELTRTMIKMKQSHIRIPVIIYQSKGQEEERLRKVDTTFFYKHTSNTPFSAAVAIPAYSLSTFQVDASKLDVIKGLESINKSRENFSRLISRWPYCNYTSERQRHHPATKKVHPTLKELLSFIDNKQEIEKNCDKHLISGILLDSLNLDSKADKVWSMETMERYGIRSLFISTYSGYTLMFNDSTNESNMSRNNQESTYYMRAAGFRKENGQNSFIFEAEKSNNLLTISSPVYPQHSQTLAAVLGLKAEISFLGKILTEVNPNPSLQETIYLIDEDGYMLYSSNRRKQNKYFGKFFGEVEGLISRHMLEKGIFIRINLLDHQGECPPNSRKTGAASRLVNPLQLMFTASCRSLGGVISLLWQWKILLAIVIDRFQLVRLTVTKNTVNCINKLDFYKVNLTALPYEDISARKDCQKAYYVETIPNTNLLLISVSNNDVKCEESDWKLQRRSLKIHEFQLGYNHRRLPQSCSAFHPDETFQDCSIGYSRRSSMVVTVLVTLILSWWSNSR